MLRPPYGLSQPALPPVEPAMSEKSQSAVHCSEADPHSVADPIAARIQLTPLTEFSDSLAAAFPLFCLLQVFPRLANPHALRNSKAAILILETHPWPLPMAGDFQFQAEGCEDHKGGPVPHRDPAPQH